MKRYTAVFIALCSVLAMSAESITAHYYGSEIDLSQKNNPCKGRTDGGIEVIVVTNVSSVKDVPNRTVVERTYSLPNGEVLKNDKEIINRPRQEVLHNLFPSQFPKIRKQDNYFEISVTV